MKKIISILSCLILILSFGISVSATENYDSVISDTADYLYKTVSNPQIGSIGGEWTVLGLARSGADIPEEYFENYYQAVEKFIKEHDGILHNKKYTEYSRVIIALSSIGKNPADVAGYNLLEPLGDFEKTTRQGINGAIWALIALDSRDYEIPQNPDANIQATREMYVNHILEKQTTDGGWALTGDVADPDITGMALQALSKYQDKDKVKTATEKALICLSYMQNENGGFSSYDTENSESNVQVIVALCELDIPYNDTRFIKNGNTILDDLMAYYVVDNGFNHTSDGSGSNLMSTEQAFYGIVAVKRQQDGKNSLYRMSDVVVSDNAETVADSDNNQEINVTTSVKTIIEVLTSREIINEKSENEFNSNGTITREQTAVMDEIAEIASMLYNILFLTKLI